MESIVQKEDCIILLGPSVSSMRVSCFKEQVLSFYSPDLRLLTLSYEVSLYIHFQHCDTIRYEALMAASLVPPLCP